MFVCKDCADTSMALSGSFGPCEICKEVRNCADIPSRYVKLKKERKEK